MPRALPYGRHMSQIGGLRPLGQLSAYGAATGAVIGGGVAALFSIPLLTTSPFGLLVYTFPAFSFGQAVGVATGFLAPLAASVALRRVRPRTLRGLRAAVAGSVAIASVLVSGTLVVFGLPLSRLGFPFVALAIVVASVLVAPIVAWRVAPVVGRQRARHLFNGVDVAELHLRR